MRDYVHLHRKILTSWVFEDARRLQLFIYLLAKADEQGMVRLSVNALSKMIGLQRMQVARLLQAMEEEGIIVQQTSNKFSTITICKYAFYNTATTDVCSTNEQQTSNKPAFQEEKEGERERNVSPTPLSYKEKEKEREENPQKKNTRTRENGQNDIEEISMDTAELDGYLERMRRSAVWLESVAMKERTCTEEVVTRLDDFRLECLVAGKLHHEDLRDVQYHFTNWLRIKRQKEKEYAERQQDAAGRFAAPGDRKRTEQLRNLQEAAAAAAYFRGETYAATLRQQGDVSEELPF